MGMLTSKKNTYWLWILLVVVITGCSKNNNYVSLEQILKNDTNNELYRYDKMGYSENKVNLIGVLVYYGIPVKISAFRDILIPAKYASDKEDKELLWNCYYKATDSDWVDRHLLLSSDSTGYLR